MIAFFRFLLLSDRIPFLVSRTLWLDFSLTRFPTLAVGISTGYQIGSHRSSGKGESFAEITISGARGPTLMNDHLGCYCKYVHLSFAYFPSSHSKNCSSHTLLTGQAVTLNRANPRWTEHRSHLTYSMLKRQERDESIESEIAENGLEGVSHTEHRILILAINQNTNTSFYRPDRKKRPKSRLVLER